MEESLDEAHPVEMVDGLRDFIKHMKKQPYEVSDEMENVSNVD